MQTENSFTLSIAFEQLRVEIIIKIIIIIRIGRLFWSSVSVDGMVISRRRPRTESQTAPRTVQLELYRPTVIVHKQRDRFRPFSGCYNICIKQFDYREKTVHVLDGSIEKTRPFSFGGSRNTSVYFGPFSTKIDYSPENASERPDDVQPIARI